MEPGRDFPATLERFEAAHIGMRLRGRPDAPPPLIEELGYQGKRNT